MVAALPPAVLAAAGARLAAVLRRLRQEAGDATLAVAYSGGVDSRFLCFALQRLGVPFCALHARGPHVPPQESAAALRWAGQQALDLRVVDFCPLDLPDVAHNSPQRCYACKQAMLRQLRGALPSPAPVILCDGSNADDQRAFRPGLRALRESGVRSPLAEAGLDKRLLRALAAAWGMDRPDQAARPCLLTRFAYGLSPCEDSLRRLAAAEAGLAALRDDSGQPLLGDFRLRLLPAPLLQASRLPDAASWQVRQVLAGYGFLPCCWQVGPHISGFHDRNTGGQTGLCREKRLCGADNTYGATVP